MDTTHQKDPVTSKLAAAQRNLTDRSNNALAKLKELSAHKRGKPTIRTDEMVEEIIDRIAAGESLLSISQDDPMPAYVTLQRWRRKDPELAARIDEAYAWGTEAHGDAMIDVALGGPMSTGDVKRDRLVIDAIKWRNSKLNAPKWGEKLEVKQTVTTYTIQANPHSLAMFDQPAIEADFIDVEPVMIEDRSDPDA